MTDAELKHALTAIADAQEAATVLLRDLLVRVIRVEADLIALRGLTPPPQGPSEAE